MDQTLKNLLKDLIPFGHFKGIFMRLVVKILFLSTLLFSQDKTKILFSWGNDASGQKQKLYTIYPDGTNLTRIKFAQKSSRGEYGASISPSGKYISTNTYHFGGWKAGIANSKGTNLRLISKASAYSFSPKFSSDEKWITYSGNIKSNRGDRRIYKIKRDNGTRIDLTKQLKYSYMPSFSPDDSNVLFFSTVGETTDIFTVSSGGGTPINLTNSEMIVFAPSWSPNGDEIAFIGVQNSFMDLYRMKSDGTNIKNITQNIAKVDMSDQKHIWNFRWMTGTSWSPNGKTIAFILDINGRKKLHTINSDGSNFKILLSENSDDQINPQWVSQ